jgi:cytochrome c oxidase subunit II
LNLILVPLGHPQRRQLPTCLAASNEGQAESEDSSFFGRFSGNHNTGLQDSSESLVMIRLSTLLEQSDVKKFWAIFFFFWPAVALIVCWISPSRGWWFPSEPMSPMGVRIDGLFYLILAIVALVFIATQVALGVALWKGAVRTEGTRADFSHGNHSLEIVWTIVPSFVLVFIALYQMDVWAEFRVQTYYPEQTKEDGSFAEVTARQFEWRMRYAAPGKKLTDEPVDGDLYFVNELHVPTGKPIKINLRTRDVQHSFFTPQLRLKQDAVPGLIIPVWFEIPKAGTYDLVCAELCGWGHYKMRAHIIAESQAAVDDYLLQLQADQNEDGFNEESDE